MNKKELIESNLVNTNVTKSDIINAIYLITKTVGDAIKKTEVDKIKKVESLNLGEDSVGEEKNSTNFKLECV